MAGWQVFVIFFVLDFIDDPIFEVLAPDFEGFKTWPLGQLLVEGWHFLVRLDRNCPLGHELVLGGLFVVFVGFLGRLVGFTGIHFIVFFRVVVVFVLTWMPRLTFVLVSVFLPFFDIEVVVVAFVLVEPSPTLDCLPGFFTA